MQLYPRERSECTGNLALRCRAHVLRQGSLLTEGEGEVTAQTRAWLVTGQFLMPGSNIQNVL